MLGFRVCVASRPPGKGKGRSLKLAARSGRSERARDWNEATLQEALIAPRSVDWPQLSSYLSIALLGKWILEQSTLGWFPVILKPRPIPYQVFIRGSTVRARQNDQMPIIGSKTCPWCSWLLANCDRCLNVISSGPLVGGETITGSKKTLPKAQRTRGLSSQVKLQPNISMSTKNLNLKSWPNLAKEFWLTKIQLHNLNQTSTPASNQVY